MHSNIVICYTRAGRADVMVVMLVEIRFHRRFTFLNQLYSLPQVHPSRSKLQNRYCKIFIAEQVGCFIGVRARDQIYLFHRGTIIS